MRASLEARNGELAARAAAHAAAQDQAHRLELMLRDSHVRPCVIGVALALAIAPDVAESDLRSCTQATCMQRTCPTLHFRAVF